MCEFRKNRMRILCATLATLAAASPAAAHLGFHENMEALEAALAETPGSPDLLFRRAEALRHQREWDRAGADYKRALSLSNGFHRARLGLAKLEFNRGRPGPALRELARYTEAEPHDWRGHQLRAAIATASSNHLMAAESWRLAIACQDRPAPGHYVARSQALATAGGTNAAAAAQCLEEGIARLGNLPVLQTELIQLHLARDKPDAALAVSEKLMSRWGQAPQFALQHAEILLRLGREAEARSVLQAVVQTIHSLPARRRNTMAQKLLLHTANEYLKSVSSP